MAAGAETLWLFVPVLRDVEAFRQLRERVLALARTVPGLEGRPLAFVVIDDSAGLDPAIAELHALPDVEVIEPPFNLGHQRALVYGLRRAAGRIHDGDLVVTLDADGQDRPEDLPRMLAPLLADPGRRRRIVLARRTERQESPAFKVVYAAFKLVFRAVTGTVIESGNYAAYRGWVARTLLAHPYFDLCYSSTLVTLGLPVEYVPCPRAARYAGESRMSFVRLVMHGFRMLMPFTDRIAIRALLAFAVIFAGATVAALGVVAVRVLTDLAVPGWATYTLLLTFLASFLAAGNALILFALVSQSQGVALRGLEALPHEATREPSPGAD